MGDWVPQNVQPGKLQGDLLPRPPDRWSSGFSLRRIAAEEDQAQTSPNATRAQPEG